MHFTITLVCIKTVSYIGVSLSGITWNISVSIHKIDIVSSMLESLKDISKILRAVSNIIILEDHSNSVSMHLLGGELQ